MLDNLKNNNRSWADQMVASDNNFFNKLKDKQAPEYLWIGCSDSRIPANQVVGLGPGELFVHRNVANLASPNDKNYLSVLQYAVEELKVRHILVVGHYGCGGIKSAYDNQPSGVLEYWLKPVCNVIEQHTDELNEIGDKQEKLNRLCELNVIHQVNSVAHESSVRKAWKNGQKLSIHGWVYNLCDGLITDLEVTIESSG
ncbi:MAG: carbonic anhydrase [Pseudomonadota bacterium]|nr:carbonic anhydrase [Pseudomonadota bacterium]